MADKKQNFTKVSENEKEIKEYVKKWLKDRIKKLLSQKISRNPFIDSLFGPIGEKMEKTFEDFYKIGLAERMITTATGNLIETIIKKFLNHKTQHKDIDFVITKGKTDYYVQLKSGPKGFTKPALEKTIQTFEKLKKTNPNIKTVIAFAYGDRNEVFSVWKKEIEKAKKEGKIDKVLVGKEFWDFFWGDGTFEYLVKIFRESAKEIKEEMKIPKNKTILQYIFESLKGENN